MKNNTPICPECGRKVQEIQVDEGTKLYTPAGELHDCEAEAAAEETQQVIED